MAYRVKTPSILSKVLYRNLVWKIPVGDTPAVYLTFDDGPHPTATPFVLDQLKEYNAKATFFCIGKNVVEHQDIYQRILKEGHRVGNHTQNHVNGWHTKKNKYITDVNEAEKHINSNLFRPPYGRITRGQISALTQRDKPYKIIMWDVLSGDFDTTINGQKCLDNVLSAVEPGSIIVFHDSQKAWDRMSYALPKVLAFCTEQKWQLKALTTT